MEFLTVSKFAEKAGVTPQAIYKRLSTDLAPYYKEENGVKLICDEGLELYTGRQQTLQTMKEKFLEEQIDRLKEELESKQQVINALYQEKSELNAKLLDILDRQTSQFQQLLAFQQLSYKELSSGSQPLNEVGAVGGELPKDEQPVDKPSLWRRLFGVKR